MARSTASTQAAGELDPPFVALAGTEVLQSVAEEGSNNNRRLVEDLMASELLKRLVKERNGG